MHRGVQRNEVRSSAEQRSASQQVQWSTAQRAIELQRGTPCCSQAHVSNRAQHSAEQHGEVQHSALQHSELRHNVKLSCQVDASCVNAKLHICPIRYAYYFAYSVYMLPFP